MKRVLVVEDDSFKSDDIQASLRQVEPNADLVLATNVAAAVDALQNGEYDLIVVDMALPSHPVVAGEGAPLSLLQGGSEVLFELQSLEKSGCCVIITQFPDIEICGDLYPVPVASAAMLEKYDLNVQACLEYSQTNHAWRDTLTTIFKKLCES
jgi:CheY-like chemotaxis protein